MLRKLLLVLSAAAMLTFGAAPAFAQPDQTATATSSNGDTTQTGNPTYSCEASGPGFAAAASGLTKKEAQDFEESHKAPGVSVKCKKD